MMVSQCKFLFVVSAFAAIAGCGPTNAIKTPHSGYYSVSSLGELPALPNNAADAKVISLVQASGDLPQYRLKSNSNILAGKDMSCNIAAGAKVAAVAERGNLLIVQASRNLILGSCKNSGDADFVEGYLNKSAAELVSAPTSEGTETSGRNAANSTAAAAKTETSSTPGACESVRYGSYLKNSKKENDDDDTSKIKDSKPKKDIAVSNIKESKSSMPGQIWREGGGDFLLLVKGKAEKWQVQAFNKTKKTQMDPKVFASSELTKSASGEYEIPFTKFVTNPNEWRGDSLQIKISSAAGANAVEESDPSPCIQEIRLASPLVLDFSGAKMIRTVAATSSGVSFDIDGDGRNEQTGWVVDQRSAFLALDLNGNGMIDNGRELFGDATRIGKASAIAKDGFEALAQYDLNHDSRIDAKDPIFKKLVVWFDKNGNGRSETNELVSLSAMGVRWISLKSAAVPNAMAFQHTESLVPNDIRMSASFSAKGCPKGICKMYDIFFGSVSQQSVAGK